MTQVAAGLPVREALSEVASGWWREELLLKRCSEVLKIPGSAVHKGASENHCTPHSGYSLREQGLPLRLQLERGVGTAMP